MMKIGILGGCFNPPHKMHIGMALELIKQKKLDKVIFVPAGDHYNKEGLLPAIDRYTMLKIVTDKFAQLEVSDHELYGELTYTYETLEYFEQKYPLDEIYFICGADHLKDFHSWKKSAYILEHYKILLVKREHIAIDKELQLYEKYKENIVVADIEKEDISSTMIRKMIKENRKNVIEMTDRDVLKYIKTKKLYL
ncbi:MAG: nicotinate (nicotinamide) nucleotide adenylyltransferase [Bacilli bacterium]|nr:nicotinate (nicotinamide) nucleotide adenylyltransferase [Bacilli bacterium]